MYITCCCPPLLEIQVNFFNFIIKLRRTYILKWGNIGLRESVVQFPIPSAHMSTVRCVLGQDTEPQIAPFGWRSTLHGSLLPSVCECVLMGKCVSKCFEWLETRKAGSKCSPFTNIIKIWTIIGNSVPKCWKDGPIK